jgi:hypothetical protein
MDIKYKTMTPKEKAHELINKFLLYSDDGNLKNKYWKIRNAKQCALIAVDFAKENPLNTYGYNKYLDDVQTEIEKL